MKTEKYSVTGMTCAAARQRDRCVSKLDGVEDVNVSLLANQMTVSYDETKTGADQIEAAVREIGYGASSLERSAVSEKGGFRSEWQNRQNQALENQQGMKRPADFFHYSADTSDVYCHGPHDGPARAVLFDRHGKRPDIGPGTAPSHHTGDLYQPPFFHRRLQGPGSPGSQYGFSGGYRFRSIFGIRYLFHVSDGLWVWSRRYGGGP